MTCQIKEDLKLMMNRYKRLMAQFKMLFYWKEIIVSMIISRCFYCVYRLILMSTLETHKMFQERVLP